MNLIKIRHIENSLKNHLKTSKMVCLLETNVQRDLFKDFINSLPISFPTFLSNYLPSPPPLTPHNTLPHHQMYRDLLLDLLCRLCTAIPDLKRIYRLIDEIVSPSASPPSLTDDPRRTATTTSTVVPRLA